MRSGGSPQRWWSSLASGVLLTTFLVALGVTASGDQADDPSVLTAGTNTYLCSGYAGCRRAGYSDSGYGARNGKMYWRMYAGHNCTNYAAYRMIQAGMSAERPWSGSGMAYNWGHAKSNITDSTPAVGAIAWWDRYDNGIGSSGHVAYVEKVISSTEIIISEDAWSGTFHWRRISKDSGRWPTGFIHFKDVAAGLTNSAAPTVSGTPQVGETLEVGTGTWSPTPRRYTYQWLADGTPVDGATQPTFTLTADQVGATISARVTAIKPKLERTSATSAATAAVTRGALVNTTPPTVEGDPIVDEQLSVVAGSWNAAPDTSQFRWKADGRQIRGATGPTLTLTRGLSGKKIAVVEIAKRDGYTRSKARSVATAAVLAGTIEVTDPFTVSGRPRLGETLTVEEGTFTPADAAVAYQWLRDGVAIPGATADTYRTVADDLGHDLTVRTVLTRRNYAPTEQVVTGPGVVRSEARLRTHVVPRPGRAVVRVRVLARGVSPVSGRVRIRVGGQVTEVALADGRARVVLQVGSGRRGVAVRYLGSDSALAVGEREHVRVPRR